MLVALYLDAGQHSAKC